MDQDNQDLPNDPGGESEQITDGENSECFSPEKEQRWASTLASEDLSSNGYWPQKSFSRSLQRAELLLRSTFTPSLKWLFQSRSQDGEEEEEEKHFVVAHNLVSRSSARLLRLQHALLCVAPQWQLVDATPWTSQACVKVPPAEGGVPVLAVSPFLQEHYSALCRLLQQRSMLLFVHEYSRRVHLAAAYIFRLQHLLEHQLKSVPVDQLPSFRPTLCSLSQELRVHLNHWPCLLSKVHSDPNLRPALVQLTGRLKEIQQTLDSLAVQAIVVMEHYIHATLCVLAQSDLELVPREVLEDTLCGTNLYNQAVEELRTQRGVFQQRTLVLQQTHCSTLSSCLPKTKKHLLSEFSVSEIIDILAQHHAKKVAKQLHSWIYVQVTARPAEHGSLWGSDGAQQVRSRGGSWTWEQLLQTYRIPSHHTLKSTLPSFTSSLYSNHTLTCRVPTSHSHTGSPSEPLQTVSSCPTSCRPPAALPLFIVGQTDPASVQLLFQVLVSSSDLLIPLVSHRPTPRGLTEPLTNPAAENLKAKVNTSILSSPADDQTDSQDVSEVRTMFNKDLEEEQVHQEWTEQQTPAHVGSSEFQNDEDKEKEEMTAPPGCGRWYHSVQWVDLGQPLVFTDVLAQYRTRLWSWVGAALWLRMHFPEAANAAASIHLQDNHAAFHVLHQISRASEAGLLSKESHAVLQDFSLGLFISAAHAQWDYDLCRSLGSTLKDKCPINQGRRFGTSSPKQDGGETVSSVTMEHFLLLSAPLISSLCCQHTDNRVSSGDHGLCSSGFTSRKRSVSLVLASLQLANIWVMSKAQQFLSSWNLNKFLLITQGDLKMLKDSMQMLVHHTDSLVLSLDGDHHSTFTNHNHILLSRQQEALSHVVSELQTFSSLVLKNFSRDCKRMSGEIFKRTMPTAGHWRPGHRTGLPRSPSEYVSLAAQSVIGQVLEGVAPLPDDARVQALSITMTAFMEAWMEHILKQKIKFSVQGALQLKEDFDSIREMIQADRYGLSAELHQRLLSLRVFQQVDSAVVCLLQQPQAKPYLQSRTWESFSQCCPATSSTDSLDTAVSSSITNLRSMEGEQLSDPSAITTDLPPLEPSNSAEPYLAPSTALNAAQQQWLDLRIQNNSRRWRLPGLQCLSKSEP
ncbi:uncharacterized protein ccdc142 isoform X2 [Gouania willdenowi]|uniref:uncharacterized protein ccdc142 isoform X2 n=1 Tax=Gouania willdenowi TaxID=441366 RepID=UPI00105595FC|nr:coiled-coil domain-containing protein 142 isoform X2 [Gouania willdenowi]